MLEAPLVAQRLPSGPTVMPYPPVRVGLDSGRSWVTTIPERVRTSSSLAVVKFCSRQAFQPNLAVRQTYHVRVLLVPTFEAAKPMGMTDPSLPLVEIWAISVPASFDLPSVSSWYQSLPSGPEMRSYGGGGG